MIASGYLLLAGICNGLCADQRHNYGKCSRSSPDNAVYKLEVLNRARMFFSEQYRYCFLQRQLTSILATNFRSNHIPLPKHFPNSSIMLFAMSTTTIALLVLFTAKLTNAVPLSKFELSRRTSGHDVLTMGLAQDYSALAASTLTSTGFSGMHRYL